MKKCLILICIFAISCKKSTDSLDNFVNNDIAIKVISSTGSSSMYSFHGANAPMYISGGLYGSHKFMAEGKINATESKIRFGIDPYDTTNTKVSCVYFSGGTNPDSYNTDVTNPGIISFTTFSNNFAQGTFNAKCKSFDDSIRIEGSFSGYYNN